MASILRPERELLGSLDVLYYDRAYKHWLPVSRHAVSPDGSHYAYTDRSASAPSAPARLHVVNVRTGADVGFAGGTGITPYIVLDYAVDGIFFVIGNEAGVAAVLLMNPATGAVKKLADGNVQASAGNKVFWVGTANPSDPHPLGALGPLPNQIDRLNLVDGSRVTWLYRPGTTVYVVGHDLGGHPIVVVSDVNGQPTEFLLLIGPGIAQSIVKGPGIPEGLASPISDRNGTWFGSPHGIYLYSDARGFVQVSRQGGYPANGCF